jgi:glucose-1-phosphate thymidylyltransferase
MFEDLLGDGSKWGMHFEYKVQEKPNGLAEAFLIGEEFIGQDDVAMILGDNMFYGERLSDKLEQANLREDEATIFGYYVKDPRRYGVVEIDENGKALSIEEKPKEPKSNYAVPGLYFYTNEVIEIAKNVKPSARGELEITDVNKVYMEKGKLKVLPLGQGYAWFDTGSPDRLSDASDFVKAIELRQGTQIACLEEIAYRNNWIDKAQVEKLAARCAKTEYGKYLMRIISDENVNYNKICQK